MSNYDMLYTPTSDEITGLCFMAYDVARSDTNSKNWRLHQLNITLLRTAQKHIQDPLAFDRSERTIAHLQTLMAQTKEVSHEH